MPFRACFALFALVSHGACLTQDRGFWRVFDTNMLQSEVATLFPEPASQQAQKAYANLSVFQGVTVHHH